MCDGLEKVGKQGNVAGTCTQDVRKVGAELKSNSDSGAEWPRWAAMRILRWTLMILLMVVLKMRPQAIGKVFGSLETEGISCILMRCYGKRKEGFEKRGGIKWREIRD